MIVMQHIYVLCGANDDIMYIYCFFYESKFFDKKSLHAYPFFGRKLDRDSALKRSFFDKCLKKNHKKK